MSLGAMTIAMQLSGLDTLDISNGDYKVRLLYEDSVRKLTVSSPALSTTSTTSSTGTSSSGFNSWGSDIPPLPSGSRHQSPRESLKTDNVPVLIEASSENDIHTRISPKISFENRNILDLASNLFDPKWDLRYSDLPKDPIHFFDNRSQYSRVNGNWAPRHTEDKCKMCGFYYPQFL